MRFFKHSLPVFAVMISLSCVAQTQKRAMTHDDYALWNAISGQKITKNGSHAVYELIPQRGDSRVIIVSADGKDADTIYCASESFLSADDAYVAVRVKAPFAVTRKMKLDKKKPDDMPKDTLVIKKIGQKETKKYASLSAWKKGKDASWIAFTVEKEKVKPQIKDTVKKDTVSKKAVAEKPKEVVKDTAKKKKVELKPLGKKLCITNPSLSDSLYTFENVTEFATNKEGSYFCFVTAEKDSVEHTKVYLFSSAKTAADVVFQGEGNVIKPVVDSLGQVAFMYSKDTAKVKNYDVYLMGAKDREAKSLKDAYASVLNEKTVISKNYSLRFSKYGTRLFFGVGAPEEKEEKDTLLAEEKAKFDLWSWTDIDLQPKQLLNAQREKTRSFMCVYTVKTKKAVRLADDNIRNINIENDGEAKVAIGFNDTKYRLSNSLNGEYKSDVYLINVSTAQRSLVLPNIQANVRLSPEQKYMVYFNDADSCYYSIKIGETTPVNISKDIKDDVLYNEDDDHIASTVRNYGVLDFTKGDNYLLVYGKYSVWQLDLSGKTAPVNITGATKEDNQSWTYVKIDDDERYIYYGQKMFFGVKDRQTKKNAIYSLVYGKTKAQITVPMSEKYFYFPLKAKNAEKYLIRWCDFNHYPELRITSSLDLKDAVTLSKANPVMDSLLWGTAELYTWRTADGQEQTGVLYKPENFDPQKKYPMIVYFYETYTDDLYRFYTPSPTYSTVNFPYFVSNDYIIFIPDIKYPKDGYPGLAAEKTIFSGTLSLIDKGFVNPKAIGI
ncbi:MAG: hypothetical protein PHD21_06455, partial [Flavobacteriales bacterium]|nr:hypothetical protein [Flavobacteriales bacterium]